MKAYRISRNRVQSYQYKLNRKPNPKFVSMNGRLVNSYLRHHIKTDNRHL